MATGILVDPADMHPVIGEPSDAISIFTDGGVLFPNRQDLAIGGFGVWIPKDSADDDEHNDIVQGIGNSMVWERWAEGTAM